MAIEIFRGEHFFLSNMYPVNGGIEASELGVEPIDGSIGRVYRALTVEHLYQASKFHDVHAQAQVLGAESGFKAKKVARILVRSEVPVREDWDDVKVDIMRELVGRKFSPDTRLAFLLLETGDEELSEGHNRGHKFWGVSPPGSGDGLNWLGHILMDTREALRDRETEHVS